MTNVIRPMRITTGANRQGHSGGQRWAESLSYAGWDLSQDSHYQLCNRFAWGWKIASLGVPVILVYLGFLNAEEMADQGRAVPTRLIEWADTIRRHAHGIVPDRAWNTRLEINGTPMCALIRAVDLRWVPSGGEDRSAI